MTKARDQSIKKVLQRNLRRALTRGDVTEAKEIHARLVEVDPLAIETRAYELELLLCERRFQEADQLADTLVGQFPGSARVQYLAGRAAYGRKKYEVAVRRLGESVAIYPSRFSRRWLARALTDKGDFDGAERLLLTLVEDDPRQRLQLAWLYERKGEMARALSLTETHLENFPDDHYAQEQRRRRVAKLLPGGEVIDEVEGLRDFGEVVPSELIAPYLKALLESARGPEARTFVQETLDLTATSPQALTTAAWCCYRLQAYDIAYDLFLAALTHNLGNAKFHAAFGKAARECKRVEDLIAVYGRHVEGHPALYGRIKGLRKARK